MKHLLNAVLATGVCAGAWASPITLPAGPLYFDYRTAEQYSPSNGINTILNPLAGGATEGNWGLVEVDSIAIGKARTPAGWQIDSLGPTVFSNGPGLGPQVLGIFYGVQNNVGQPGISTGGTLDMYYWNSNNQDVDTELTATSPSKRSGVDGNQYSGFTCQTNGFNCTFLARFHFRAGADVASQVNTIYNAPGTTNFETYFSVDTTAPGFWTDALASNYFTLNPIQQACGGAGVSCSGPNDVRADGTYAGAAGWDIGGTDIVGLRKNGAFRAFDVPETDSLTLTLTALGAAWAMRRRIGRCRPTGPARP
jgi:hypothetical protein